jgi:small subunit ribosomal protein S20
MANTKSAQKAVRKIARRTAVNKMRRSEMRTFVRKVEEALEAKDASGAATALHEAEPLVARAAQKGMERDDVEEYCISENWIRAPVGKTRDRKGNLLTIRMTGPVEAYFLTTPEAAPL